MKKIAVVGTGLSALSLAHHLPSLDITFFEKSWRPGGRISTRKHGEYAFDHGAHYLKKDHGMIGVNEFLESPLVFQGFFIEISSFLYALHAIYCDCKGT